MFFLSVRNAENFPLPYKSIGFLRPRARRLTAADGLGRRRPPAAGGEPSISLAAVVDAVDFAYARSHLPKEGAPLAYAQTK
jgi:hypothetical protein